MRLTDALRRAAERWERFTTELTALRLLRRQWGLVGRWLGTYHKDKSKCRAQRTWWHLIGERLKEIKWRGLEEEEEDPLLVVEEVCQPGAGGSSSSSSAVPQISVQINVNVNHAGPTDAGACLLSIAGQHEGLGDLRGRTRHMVAT